MPKHDIQKQKWKIEFKKNRRLGCETNENNKALLKEDMRNLAKNIQALHSNLT